MFTMPECEQPVKITIPFCVLIASALSSGTKSGSFVSLLKPTGDCASKSFCLLISHKNAILLEIKYDSFV